MSIHTVSNQNAIKFSTHVQIALILLVSFTLTFAILAMGIESFSQVTQFTFAFGAAIFGSVCIGEKCLTKTDAVACSIFLGVLAPLAAALVWLVF